MAKWGKTDYRQLLQLQKNIEDLSKKVNMDAFCEACCKELAARLLALVIPATPVGIYTGEEYVCVASKENKLGTAKKHKGKKAVGKKGGTLRRGWTAGVKQDARAYAQSLNITKAGGDYMIEIINPVYYASYVEYGHRRSRSGGWVEGHMMLKKSEGELRELSPKILEKKLRKYLKEVFNV